MIDIDSHPPKVEIDLNEFAESIEAVKRSGGRVESIEFFKVGIGHKYRLRIYWAHPQPAEQSEFRI